ncbi:uncharacterized protein LOC128995487 [Macrosteles quadrilineatus]|uniref:uncharacterized protein LOC128995487 n=1 Tax=Macrosteles quadrilineatus TaxID=74068 RepID=UPI0023E2FE32|nr:uncharacterized protein LOC128995487 [Macrosteles quadrilineatus]
MSTCGVCKKSSDDGSSVIKCSACGSLYHAECLKQDGETVKTRAWKCKECRVKTPSNASSSSTSTVITKEFFLSVIESLKREIAAELKAVKSDTVELKSSIQHLSDTVDDVSKQFADFKKEIGKLKKDNEELLQQNVVLNSKVTDLQERLRTLEQYSRKTNVEISGIPKSPNEDVRAIVGDIGRALGLEVQPSQIAAAHRIPSFNKTRTPSLVVQFTERATKETFISKYKESRASGVNLTANRVNNTFPHDRVYVNDHLSPENKQFFAKLKKKCNELGYTFVWSRDGKFFVKRSAGEKTIKVST